MVIMIMHDHTDHSDSTNNNDINDDDGDIDQNDWCNHKKKDRLMTMMITTMLPIMSIAIIVITPTIIGLYSGSSYHNYASYNSEWSEEV